MFGTVQKQVETVQRGNVLVTVVKEVFSDGTETRRCISFGKPVELSLVEDDRGHEMILNYGR